MSFQTAAHRVTKIVINPESKHILSGTDTPNAGSEFAHRSITLQFDDGTEQQIDVYSQFGLAHLPVEIQ